MSGTKTLDEPPLATETVTALRPKGTEVLAAQTLVSEAITAVTAGPASSADAALSGPRSGPGSFRDPLEGTRYRMVDRLGAGGMGEVLLAEHRLTGHVVAIKLLQVPRGADEDSLRLPRRFLLEAQTLARLRHPNLVAVHDFQTTPDGRPFMVMDHLSGMTLHERLQAVGGGPLPLAELLDLAQQVCAGLGALHAAGIVHRDLKPGNLFICRDGTLKILDLGLAKIATPDAATATPPPLTAQTDQGLVLGTPRYISPEQVAGEPVRPATDQYALGCILYRGLTGRGPFDHIRDLADLFVAHVGEVPEPPSHHLTTPLPKGLDALVLRCLEKSPERRFESVAALAEALSQVRAAMTESDAFGEGFVTQPMLPPTVMMEPWLQADAPLALPPLPPAPPPPRTVTLPVFVWIVLGFVLAGGLIGGWLFR
ncbi:MAG: serine/threonine-protein kinase [Polyangiaceae bacterium]